MRNYTPEAYQRQRERIQATNKRSDNKNSIKRVAYRKQYQSEHKEQNRQYLKEYSRKIKLIILAHYSDNDIKCSCCGEHHIEFMVLDHINGGGNKDRKGKGGLPYYRHIINQGFPIGFRVLCDNCNMSMGRYGYCPHQTIK